MLSMPPTKLWTYLRRTSFQVPPDLTRYFYASWEDALWDLIRQLPIAPGSVALVPEFFCGDVVTNMEEHGLKIEWYPSNPDLSTPVADFIVRVKATKPAVVIVFHPVGITNQLWSQSAKWLPLLSPETLIIEDSVHRVVNPGTLKLLAPRHVVLDSLRKVVPLAGCNVYTKTGEITLTPTPWWKTIPYQLALYGWWLVFQMCLHLAALPLGSSWKSRWDLNAEKMMLRGYDVIGDSYQAGSGWPIFAWLATHLDFARIAAAKLNQVRIYQEVLEPLTDAKKTPFFFFPFPASDAGLLRAFPLGIEIKQADHALKLLRQAGILTRFELNDSPWSTRQKVVYLPLGPHQKDQDVRELAQRCREILAELL